MNPTLSRYVEAVRGICREGLSMPAKVARIQTEAARMVDELELTDEERFIPADGYGRNLLYRDPDHGFVVIAMVWPPGRGGCPHDHATWGVVAVTEGTIRIENYMRLDDGRDPGVARLEKTEQIDAGRGGLGRVLPPHEDIHNISNPLDEGISVSIHTYGRDIRRCRVFDAETGAITHVELGYHTGDAPARAAV